MLHGRPIIPLVMSQLKGAGIIMPAYLFLHYLTTAPKNYPAADHRFTNIAYAKTIVPALTFAYMVPSAVMYFYPDILARQYSNVFWQLFPVWLSLSHRLFSYCVKDTTPTDCTHNTEADLPYLRRAYTLTGVVSASVYLFLWVKSPYPLKDVFFSGLSNPGKAVVTIAIGSARFLRYDQICTLGAGLYWTAIQFWDLKRAERTTTSWLKFLGTMTLSTISLGPGAAMAGFGYWKETLREKKI
jgi:hypothetical protein